MLSRIANDMFWMGRYLKRAEFIARFTEVQFFATLDAPLIHKKKSSLMSILSMSGFDKRYYGSHPSLFDDAVLFWVVLDETNESSVLSSVSKARENARGARDLLSVELWEAINRYFHELRRFPFGGLKNDGSFTMLQKISYHAQVVQAMVDTLLLHDNVWAFIKLGMRLETAAQVLRVAKTKYRDIKSLEDELIGTPMENYQWTTLLKSIGDVAVSRKTLHMEERRRLILDFILLNREYPRSVAFNLGGIDELLRFISPVKEVRPGTVEFEAGKIAAAYRFLTVDDVVKREPGVFMDEALGTVYALGQSITRHYFGA